MHTIEVAFPAPIVKVTKREILRKIAKIYDRSGLGSPVTLAGTEKHATPALFETAEPNTSKESPDQSLLKRFVGRRSSRKKVHKSDARVQPGFRMISNVSISRRTQMDFTNVEVVSRDTIPFTFQMILCSAKGCIVRPPSDSPLFDNGEDTRKILETSPQKANKESDK